MLDQNEVELSVVLLQSMVCWVINMVLQKPNIHSAEAVRKNRLVCSLCCVCVYFSFPAFHHHHLDRPCFNIPWRKICSLVEIMYFCGMYDNDVMVMQNY